LYDADIAANDASFGEFVDRLSALGLYENSLLVFVSDHGEEFYEHGSWEHGNTLYDEQILVPLLIKFPGRRMAGRRTDIVANHVDLLPTLIASAGATIPDGSDGRSLLPYLAGEIDDRGPAISYVKLDGIESESILLDRSKFIRNLADDHVVPRRPTELYDLARDPTEHDNLVLEQPVQAGFLQTLLRGLALKGDPALSAEAAELPEHVREQLRALGYSP
jgi:arylsulfatase A-like enzyme